MVLNLARHDHDAVAGDNGSKAGPRYSEHLIIEGAGLKPNYVAEFWGRGLCHVQRVAGRDNHADDVNRPVGLVYRAQRGRSGHYGCPRVYR